MNQILFVDDEQKILDGLRRNLRSMRDQWTMMFACGGEEALTMMEGAAVDVIVSDMRMPGMDGAELLRQVQQRHPHVIRVILSGQSDKEMVLESIGSTHLFLSKPCEKEALQATIERACALRAILQDKGLRALVGRMRSIPSMPKLYAEIKSLVESDQWSLKEVGQIISRDVGMTARVLQVVNSAYFGTAENISTIEQAVNFLGVDVIESLALSEHVFSKCSDELVEMFPIDRLWLEGAGTGTLAREIARAEQRPLVEVEQAFIAGLLHDTGILMFAINHSRRYRAVLDKAQAQQRKITEVEQKEFNSSHAEVGAYLLGLWGVSEAIVEAVALHHRPGDSGGTGFTPLTAVHAADVLYQEVAGAIIDCPPSLLDMAYLERANVADRVPQWRELASQLIQEVKS